MTHTTLTPGPATLEAMLRAWRGLDPFERAILKQSWPMWAECRRT